MVQAVIELNEADAARTIASGEVSANRVEDYVAAPIVPDKEISAETIEQLEREVEALRREAETLEAKSREFRLPPLVSVRSGAFVKVFSLLVFLAGVATGLSTCMIVAGAH